MRLSEVVEVVIPAGPEPVEGGDGDQLEEQGGQDVHGADQTVVVGLNRLKEMHNHVPRNVISCQLWL